MTSVVDAEFCSKLTFCLLHSLWVGSCVAVLAFIFSSQIKSSQLRYYLLLVAEFSIVFCLPLTYVYFNHRQSVSQTNVVYASPAGAAAKKPPLAVNSNLPTASARIQSVNHSYSVYIVAGYGIGVAGMLIRLIAGLSGGKKLVKASRPILEWRVLRSISRAVDAMKFSYNPAIAYCNSIAVPCVVGILRPTILLPFSLAAELTPQQLEVLVMHELAHICRCDHVVNLFQRLLEAFLFYHPAVWYLARAVRKEREICCDDMVVAVSGSSQKYASSIVRAMEINAADPLTNVAVSLSLADKQTDLRYRVMRLIQSADHQNVRLKRSGVIAANVLFATILFASIATGVFNRHTLSHVSEFSKQTEMSRGAWSPLHYAAAYESADQVNTLLSSGADPNVAESSGWTPLHFAVALNRREITELLLARGADVNATSIQGRTPLHAALGMGPPIPESKSIVDDDMVKYLLDKGAGANAADQSGFTPLHAAVLGRHQASVVELLQHGAHLDARDTKGRTPLLYAAMIADRQIIDLLLHNGADVKAVDGRGWSVMDMLGLQTHTNGNVTSAEVTACIEPLRAAGAKLDLCAAVSLSLKNEVAAELEKNPSLANTLPPTTINGYTLLHWSACNGDADMCKLLIKYGANVAARNTQGRTPLHLAVSRIETAPEVVEVFLKAGAPVNVQDNLGSSPLHDAVSNNAPGIVDLLIESGADVNSVDQDGTSPLYIATAIHVDNEENRLAVIRSLLRAKANLNAADAKGQTPLHLASWAGNEKLVELYLSAGA
ncbi:MAG TPA: ankyrin repeat domain-containing protein, partial [Tepidisphaeraceae bacterium]|nr:ankyrin repeat domain-containing protein [Tepidisphaeraceae bacterium]